MIEENEGVRREGCKEGRKDERSKEHTSKEDKVSKKTSPLM